MSYYGEPLSFSGYRTPLAVRILLIVTIGVFIIQLIADRGTDGDFTYIFGLSRSGLLQGCLWQLATYMFLHSGLWHILINMFFLAIFGREVEETLGTKRFTLLYFAAGILGGVGWLLISGARPALCIGASGAVFGIMGTFAAMFPDRPITMLVFFVLPVTMTARTLAIISAGIALLSLFAEDGTVAHTAHLAGGVAGYVYGIRVSGQSVFPGCGQRRWKGGVLSDWLSGLRARARRRGMKIVSPRNRIPTSEDVDVILDKITEQGIGSLSQEERDMLDSASRKKY